MRYAEDTEYTEPSDVDIEQRLLSWIQGNSFTCLAARSAARRKNITVRVYPELGRSDSDEELHAELTRFATTQLSEASNFASFCAIFRGPAGSDEEAFEQGLWDQLNRLHRIDTARYPWSPDVSADPASPDFGFSVAAHPFFVAGMNPASSRISRRFAYPALVFNSHHQFQRLKDNGVYFGLKDRIRAREIALQGNVNPMLADHGTISEAPQYSGRVVDADWTCPFHPVIEHPQG
jgi:FPC/CPF motif-containing protein YcgG